MADEDEDEAGGDDGAAAGDGGWAAGLEMLLDLATTVIETAHAIAVAAVAGGRKAQLERVAALRQAGTDLATLAEACEVLIRRQADHRP